MNDQHFNMSSWIAFSIKKLVMRQKQGDFNRNLWSKNLWKKYCNTTMKKMTKNIETYCLIYIRNIFKKIFSQNFIFAQHKLSFIFILDTIKQNINMKWFSTLNFFGWRNCIIKRQFDLHFVAVFVTVNNGLRAPPIQYRPTGSVMIFLLIGRM